MIFLKTIVLWLLLFVTLWRFQESFLFLVPFRLGIVSVILAAILILATNAKDLFIILQKTPLHKYFICIAILGLLSIPFSVYISNAIIKYTDLLRTLLTTSIVIALAKNNKKSMQLSVIIILIFFSIQMFLQRFDGRASVSLTYDPNDTALLCVVFLPLALHGITQKNFFIKILSFIASIASIISIALTGSRGGLLALVALALYTILIVKKRRFLLIIFCGIGVLAFMAMAGEELWIRIQAIIDGTDYNLAESGDSRLAIWGNAVEIIFRRPFFGVGIGQFSNGIATLTDSPWKTAHNSFLEIGVELGIGGLYAFCAILYSIFKLSKNAENAPFLSQDEKNLYLCLRLSVVAFCVGGFFVSHAYSSITYTFFAFAFVMFLDYEKKERLYNEEMLENQALQKTDAAKNQSKIENLEESNFEKFNTANKPQVKTLQKQQKTTKLAHNSSDALKRRELKKSRLEEGDKLKQNKN